MWIFAAIVVSTLLIVLLCRGDPKRRRTASLPGSGQSPVARRLLASAAWVPGLFFALQGDAAAFLVWLGGCSVIGWFVALWFARPRRVAD